MGIAGKVAKTAFKGIGVVSPMFEYKRRVNEGEGKLSSLAKTAVEEVGWAIAPGAMALGTFAPMAVDLANTTGQYGGQARSSMHKANFGGNFVDTQGAYTMRQRGVQAMQNSGMNTSSVLGSEARRTRGVR